MKLNGWSIVRSPAGVSLRPLDANRMPGSGEVCIHILDGVISVTVHADGVDEPVSEMRVPLYVVRNLEEN